MQPSGYGNLSDGRLDATFAALADPTRRAILARLASGEASVRELTEPFAMSQAAVSKHLKVLERAGLISQAQDAQRRPRRLDAPRMMVWDAYTRPELVKRWLGAMPGWSWAVCEMDVRKGGRYRWAW